MGKKKKDWNAYFKKLQAKRGAEDAEILVKAKAKAEGTEKEPFNSDRYKELYLTMNDNKEDDFTDWDTILDRAEYHYYVSYPDKMSLKEFIEYEEWLEGFS